ncbi:MAG TPA: tetratricopeptide repeat protein, partial [Cytophagales bacterium]
MRTHTLRLAVLLLLRFTPGLAADATVDSLLHQLKQVRDTSRVNVLNQLSFQFKGRDPVRSMTYARQAAALSRQLDFPRGLAYAYNHIGAGHSNLNQYPEAITWFTRALTLYRQLADTRGEQAALVNIGMVYHKQNNFPKAVEYYLLGLRLAEQRDDKVRTANVLSHLGDVYSVQQDFPTALSYYTRSLAL